MPHVPKQSKAPRYAKLGPKHEPAVQIQNNSGAVQGPQAGAPDDSMHKAPKMGGQRLSLVRFEVPAERVFEQLFGEGLSIDQHTGIAQVPGVSKPVVPGTS